MDNTSTSQQDQNMATVPAQPAGTQGDVSLQQPSISSGQDIPAGQSAAQHAYSVFPQQQPSQPSENHVASVKPAAPLQKESDLGVQQPAVVPLHNAPLQSTGSQPASAQEESRRITLEDLYCPSSGDASNKQPAVPYVSSQDVALDTQPDTLQPATIETIPQDFGGVSKEQTQEPVQEIVQHHVQDVSSATSSEAVRGETPVTEKTNDEGNTFFSKFMKFAVSGFVLLLIGLLVVGAVYFLLKGQNNNGSGSGGNVSLTYWGLWEDNSVMAPILADFHKKYPNITVNYVRQDPKQYVQRLVTRMKNGDGPDVFILHNTWVEPLQSALLPLPTSVISAKKLETDYPQVVKDNMVMNGVIYGLPTSMDVLSLFVNDDIFSHAGASVPTTWDNFITVAKGLTVKDPNGRIQTAGAALGTYGNIDHAPDIMSLLFLQNSANLMNLKGSQNAADALTFYTSFAGSKNNVWDATLDNALLAFERGKLAMYFGYAYDIFAIQAANPNLHFSVHPVPHLPGENITIASYWVNGVSSQSKHPKEAMEFMQFLAQKNTQQQLYTEEAKSRAFGELYARTDLAQGLVGNKMLAPFVSQFNGAKSSFFVADTGFTDYNDALNQYLGNAIISILNNVSVDTAAATLADGVSQITSQYATKSP